MEPRHQSNPVRAVFVIIVSLATAVACDGAVSRSPVKRVLAATAWDTVWSTPSVLTDTLLPSPSNLLAVGNLLVVLDDTRRVVVGIDARSGDVRWTAGRSGSGPGELEQPIALARSDEQGVLVLDEARRRLLHVDTGGRIEDRTSFLRAGQSSYQACARQDHSLLMADASSGALRILDADGTYRDSLDSVWPDLRSLPPASQQVWLRSHPHREICALSLVSGRGFALLRGDTLIARVPYVEVFDVVGAGERAGDGASDLTAALDVDFVGDTLTVLFNGRSPLAGRVLDRYHALSGAYLSSVVLPLRTSDIALAGPLVIARVLTDSTPPVLLALRPR